MSQTTPQSSKSKGKFLEGLSAIFRSSTPQSADAARTFQASARELNSALEGLKSSIQKQKEEEFARTASQGGTSTAGTAAAGGPTPQQIAKRELESAVSTMRANIVELHSQLKTGLSEQSLAQMEVFFSELLEQTGGQELDARIRAAIAERVNRELGPLTWKILLHFMERSGAAWPEPSGLMPTAGAEERARAIAQRMAEAEELFLGENLEKCVGTMRGIVSAWKRYPDPASWLWREVVFRGVAAGIRCQLMQVAVEKLRSEGEALRAEANKLLSEPMARIQTLLQAGVQSIEDAEKIVHGTDNVINEVLPELAWGRAKASVEQAVSTLAGR